MKMFATASALVSWCGLRPRNEESAGRIKGRRIVHGNKYLRTILIECSWAASKNKNILQQVQLYSGYGKKEKQDESPGRNSQKMLVAIWNILQKTRIILTLF